MFDLILEAASLGDIYQKYYSDIPQDEFTQIIQSDPTFNPETPDKMGKYGKWLLSLYKNGNLKLEDLYKSREYLSYFIKFYNKIQQKDINKYKTLPDLYNTVQPFIDNPEQATSKSDEVRKIKEGANKIYEDGEWLVISPQTEEASIYYGKNTQWCTAAEKSQNMFSTYRDDGELYININKKTNEKYQFHFESGSYMDATDNPIDRPIANEIGLPYQLVNLYIHMYGMNAAIDLLSMYDYHSITLLKGSNIFFLNETSEQLMEFVPETNEVVCIAEENGGYFGDVLYGNRFVMYYSNNDYTLKDLFDVETNEYISDKMNCIIEYIIHPTSAYFNIVTHEGKNYILEINTGQIYDMGDNVQNTTLINMTVYRQDIQRYHPSIMVCRLCDANNQFKVAGYVNNQPFTDFYDGVEKLEVYNSKGEIRSFVGFTVKQRYGIRDVLLYDGTVVSAEILYNNQQLIDAQG
jgi:hypothetical protein